MHATTSAWGILGEHEARLTVAYTAAWQKGIGMYRAIVRRRVVQALSTGSLAPGQLQDELFDLDGSDVARELRELVRRKAVTHNGKVGRGSRYSRVA